MDVLVQAIRLGIQTASFRTFQQAAQVKDIMPGQEQVNKIHGIILL